MQASPKGKNGDMLNVIYTAFIVDNNIVLSLQLYERRKKVLKSEKETKLWKSIDYNFMTEESDGGDDIRQHSLPWRSGDKVTSDVRLCKLIHVHTNGV